MPTWEYIVLGIHVVYAAAMIIDLYRNPRFPGAFRLMLLATIVVFIIIGPTIYLVIRDAEPKSQHFKE